MGVRQSWTSLTQDQQTAFVNAVLTLKNSTASVLHPDDATRHRYDDFVETHLLSMSNMPGWAHMGPAFFPWHRQLLRQFELELQQIDETINLPYWDWIADGNTVFDSLLGGTGEGADGQVQDGSFAFSTGKWTVVVKDSAAQPDFLARALGGAADAPALPTQDQLDTVLANTDYDTAPWDDMQRQAGQFVGFRPSMEVDLHNLVHRWVGGTMLMMTSPNDPIFWMHHCNIDRLWAVWEQQHTSAFWFEPGGGAPAGHNAGDFMIFKNAADPAAVDPWTDQERPADVINNQPAPMAYAYDTDPANPVIQQLDLSQLPGAQAPTPAMPGMPMAVQPTMVRPRDPSLPLFPSREQLEGRVAASGF